MAAFINGADGAAVVPHKVDFLSNCPLELTQLVVEYLEDQDLQNCALVSKQWNFVAVTFLLNKEKSFFSNIFRAVFPLLYSNSKPHEKGMNEQINLMFDYSPVMGVSIVVQKRLHFFSLQGWQIRQDNTPKLKEIMSVDLSRCKLAYRAGWEVIKAVSKLSFPGKLAKQQERSKVIQSLTIWSKFGEAKKAVDLLKCERSQDKIKEIDRAYLLSSQAWEDALALENTEEKCKFLLKIAEAILSTSERYNQKLCPGKIK